MGGCPFGLGVSAYQHWRLEDWIPIVYPYFSEHMCFQRSVG
jgi:hypothetical protein